MRSLTIHSRRKQNGQHQKPTDYDDLNSRLCLGSTRVRKAGYRADRFVYILETFEMSGAARLQGRYLHSSIRRSTGCRGDQRTSETGSVAVRRSRIHPQRNALQFDPRMDRKTRFAYIKDQELEYSFINSHYWDAGLAGQSLSNLLKIPHMHTPHSIGSWKKDNMDGSPEELERKYNFGQRIREEKIIYDECDVLVATTPQQRDLLKNSNYDVPAEKIRVIPPGYDDSRFFPISISSHQALKQEKNIEGPVVLALGRMAHNKGYDLLIRSMSYVIERVPEARLILAVGSTETIHPRDRTNRGTSRTRSRTRHRSKYSIRGLHPR